MIQQESRLTVADNSGAKLILIIRNLGSSKVKFSRVGDVVIGTVKKALPNGIVKKKQIVRAVIVRTKRKIMRKTGESIFFQDNACVIINKDNTPVGTRIFGSVAREIREKGFVKITSWAKEAI